MINKKFNSGFTLIELMIAVVVIGILASIAYPSYTEYVRNAKRAEARVALVEILQQQERYMTQNNSYLAFASGATNVPFKTYSGASRDSANYLLSASACSNEKIENCVKITATPQHADASAGSITITSTGEKTCTGEKKSSCW